MMTTRIGKKIKNKECEAKYTGMNQKSKKFFTIFSHFLNIWLYIFDGCGGVNRTHDLKVMSLASYHCSTPRYGNWIKFWHTWGNLKVICPTLRATTALLRGMVIESNSDILEETSRLFALHCELDCSTSRYNGANGRAWTADLGLMSPAL